MEILDKFKARHEQRQTARQDVRIRTAEYRSGLRKLGQSLWAVANQPNEAAKASAMTKLLDPDINGITQMRAALEGHPYQYRFSHYFTKVAISMDEIEAAIRSLEPVHLQMSNEMLSGALSAATQTQMVNLRQVGAHQIHGVDPLFMGRL